VFSVIANTITTLTILLSMNTVTMTKLVVAFKDPNRCEGILLERGIK